MATANQKHESSIESDAMDAIDCFTDGIDGVIYELAERSAVLRGATEDGIVITVADIEEATKTLVLAIKNQADIPEDIKSSVEEMLDCCSRKLGS